MAETSSIEWTDATWNPITGCSVISPGCTNCYAMKLAGTRLKHHASRAGLTVETRAGPVWNGHVRLNEGWLPQPLRWTRPRRIFVCAHGDLFHESVPDEWIDKVFAVMALGRQHTFQVLTKRAGRMRAYVEAFLAGERHILGEARDISGNARLVLDELVGEGPGDEAISVLPNVWLGVSAEDQARADERVPELMATPAAVRFVSVEPMLGPVDLRQIRVGRETIMPLAGVTWYPTPPDWPVQGRTARHSARLDWVILGGESGDRPMHPDWARQVRDQCEAAGVAFFFKQWGTFAPASALPAGFTASGFSQWLPGSPAGQPAIVYRVGKKAAGRLLDGVEHNGMPERGDA